MVAKVAIVEMGEDPTTAFTEALQLIGGIADLTSPDRSVVVKVGVFNPVQGQHTTVSVTRAIVESFTQAPKVFLVESDNYRGTATERLKIWQELFSDRVIPYNLTEATTTRPVMIAGEEKEFAEILFKPNVFISTHALRRFDKGTILKNLLGLIPEKRKARFHKKLEPVLLDTYEAIGGIDLAVIDATYTYPGPSARQGAPTNTLVVGRDAVAVDVVGAVLVGMKPEKMPVLQKAIQRGFGEGNIENIEVLGASLEELANQFRKHLKALKKK